MSFNLSEVPPLSHEHVQGVVKEDDSTGFVVDDEPATVLEKVSEPEGPSSTTTAEATIIIGEAVEPQEETIETAEIDDGSSASDDDDDWDEISKGRYFGAENDNDAGPLCHNCKQSGHKKKDCPHQLCRSCGALDDHDTMRCPMTQRCYNCSRLGHVASKCPEPHRQVGSYCRDCGSKTHLARSCPQIWRLYEPAKEFNIDGDWSITVWCYNCAARGHYGDDCPRPHRMRLLEPSAFCMANQPESRTDRLERELQERRDAERHHRLDEEERQEDWFLRQTSTSQTKRPGVNYNSFQHGNSSRDYPPPLSAPAGRGRRYDPYSRPSRPIITSERYPRGLPARNGDGKASSSSGSSGKRKPVPAVQRLAAQNQSKSGNSRQSTRGGKPYRGGGGGRR